MTHRIILFRGMNTGGVRAPAGEQRAMAEAMGLKNPRTLQASGNLVVESGKAAAALEADIEAAMDRTFGLKVAAMVRTPEQWARLIAANPFPAEARAHPARVQAMVMKDGIRDGALEACRALAEDGEAVQAVDGVLYFWFPKGQGESAIFRKGTPRMLGMGTGRNWNTVLKLADMVELKA
ncbi:MULTISPECIES: DUF1697 domain-containing protein [unclassified Brevundimonas]|uniref:DUF1697 domain-containing protein n=1 Tax=unclassified Brevundimonas TaxID=2622653 RepID=UPI0006FCFE86|nr:MULTISPECIES: DUF1697 domain-containing protein [unclassified Brevundimonas]KQY90808.1 hypothetical protein ASD25_20015 [Brevundimonas sp. Root1423]KRA28485.1 hypothetical protein ASD59_01250 [Brevundimonas sp. Root608]